MIKFENMWNVIARSGDNRDVAISLIKGFMNKESLFARVACFRRLPRLRLAMTMKNILAMTFPTLAFVLVLSLGVVDESWADNVCLNGTNSCGENCCYTINNKTVNFSRIDESKTATIEDGIFKGKQLTTVDIPSWITSIGKRAFQECKLQSVTIPDSVTNIDEWAFYNNKLVNVVIPSSITELKTFSFVDNYSLKTIIIPDSVVSVEPSALGNSGAFKNLTIICKGNEETCNALENSLREYKYYAAGWNDYDISEKLILADKQNCDGKEYFWTGIECSRKEEYCDGRLYYNGAKCLERPKNPQDISCVGGYAKIKGNCVDPLKTFAKKRYTPAEAAQWLNEENNTVTLTFKK